MTDKIFTTAVAVTFVMAFSVYSTELPFCPNAYMFDTPPVTPLTPAPGVLGMAGNPFYYVPPASTSTTTTSTTTSATTISTGRPSPIPQPNNDPLDPDLSQFFPNVAAGGMGVGLYSDDSNFFDTQLRNAMGLNIGSRYNNSPGSKKRSVTTTCTQVMIRGIDYTLFTGTIFWRV